MDLSNYQEAAQRTSKEPDRGVQDRLFSYGDDLSSALRQLAYWSRKIEDLKKKIFYNSAKMEEPADLEIPAHVMVLLKNLHGIVGIASELHELITPIISQDPLISNVWRGSKQSALEEGGDVLWYLAELLEANNLTFEQVAQVNIEKLYSRYPEKFDNILALRRDLEQEAEVIKTGLRAELHEIQQKEQIVELMDGEESSGK